MVVEAVLAAAQWSPESVDVVPAQQHTRKIVYEIVGMTGIPETRAMLLLHYAGNAASANIPLALSDAKALGRLNRGSRVIVLGGSSGFSW